MAFPVTTRLSGYLVTHTTWNADLVDNLNTLRAGGLAVTSQASGDFFRAASASTTARMSPEEMGLFLEEYG